MDPFLLLAPVLLLLPCLARAGNFAVPLNATNSPPGFSGQYGICPFLCVPLKESYYSNKHIHKYNATALGITHALQCRDYCLQQNYTTVWGDFAHYQGENFWTCECYTACDKDTLYNGDDGHSIFSFAVLNCLNTTAQNDPHFVGGHGTRFDFNGDLGKSYCLVTDVDYQVNALLHGYDSSSIVGASMSVLGKGVRSWMRELAILWFDKSGARHSLHLVATRGKISDRTTRFLKSVSVDNAAVPLPGQPGKFYDGSGLVLTFKGVGHKSGGVETYEVVTDKLILSVELIPASPLYQLQNDSFIHFNLKFDKFKTSSHVHGVLGQTFRRTPLQALKALKYRIVSKLLGEPVKADGASGHGFLDGESDSYVTPSILDHGCKFSRFPPL